MTKRRKHELEKDFIRYVNDYVNMVQKQWAECYCSELGLSDDEVGHLSSINIRIIKHG